MPAYPRPRPTPNPNPTIPPPLPSWNRPPAPPAPPGPSNPVVTGVPGNMPPYWDLATQSPGPGYAPPQTTPTSGDGGGGGGNPTGPGGNWFDPTAGPHGEWKDAWGNVIPHMNYGYNDQGQPDLPQYGGPAPAAPTPGTVPTPPTPGGPYNGTFYAPTTPSPYLTLPDNFLGLLGADQRAQVNQWLQSLGFAPTGQFGTFGESMYLRPEQFQAADLDRLSDPVFRQWLRFFLGFGGYGTSYTLPGAWTGPGLPPAPPITAPPAPPVLPPTGGPTPAPAPPPVLTPVP